MIADDEQAAGDREARLVVEDLEVDLDRGGHGEVEVSGDGCGRRAAYVLDLGTREEVARGRRNLRGVRAIGGDIAVRDDLVVRLVVRVEAGRVVELAVAVAVGEEADARAGGRPARGHRDLARHAAQGLGVAEHLVDEVAVLRHDEVVALHEALARREMQEVLVLVQDVEERRGAVEEDRDAGDQRLRVRDRLVVARDDAVRDAGPLIDHVVGGLGDAERGERGDVGALEAARVRPRLGGAAGVGDRAHRAADRVGAGVVERVIDLEAGRAGLEDVRRRAIDAVLVDRIHGRVDGQGADALDVEEVVVAALADRAQHGDAALRAVGHDIDVVGLARAAEQIDHAELAEVIVDGLVRAVGEHRIDQVATLRDHADHARRRLHDEGDAIVLDEEISDETALRGTGDELARIGDLPRERELRLAGGRGGRRVEVGEARVVASARGEDQ